MNMLLDLFLEFLKIGFFMFGGGYGGLALLHKEMVEMRGWLTDEEFVNILGIAESTPGPVAVNMATFIGYRVYGVPGSAIATLGVVLPAYAIILGIVMGLSRYFENPAVKTVLRGINAAVVALILVALIKVGHTVLIRDGLVGPVELSIFIIAFATVMVLKQHPIVAITTSIALSLMLKYMLGI
ncbi:MAG: chromate transporter [Zestosphaera sp.]